MNIDVNGLINLAGTLGAVALGAWLTARTTSRAEAKAEQDTLGRQFEAMVVAVAGLRAAIDADKVLRSSWLEWLRTFALASVTGLAPAAFVRGSDRRQIAAAIGGAGWYLALERERMKTATASLVPKLEAVVAAAAPLMRHSDPGIREATEHFRTAAFQYHESRRPEEFEAAAANFGTAVRAILYPPARRRLPWRRHTQ
ncbi:hypothetical protein [Streptomyces sp. CA-106110]|uniref:hypothetical protein n=1 Tax=Streptomyces sp. CA-106110 TaxID=3240044 RepID=UPI003D8ECF9B